MSMRKKVSLVVWVLAFGFVACTPPGEQEQVSGTVEAPAIQVFPPSPQIPSDTSDIEGNRDYEELEIVTLLPRDGIPAIDDPEFLSVEAADEEYTPDELVIGVNYGGDARAYSIPFLSRHEIVNDAVGGKKIAVTW